MLYGVLVSQPKTENKTDKQTNKPRKKKRMSYKKVNQHSFMITELINSKNWDLELVCATPLFTLSRNMYVS